METITLQHGDTETTFEGRKLDEKMLGTGPEDTKKITYYETLDGRYLKHTVHGVSDEEAEQQSELEEVSSFEVP